MFRICVSFGCPGYKIIGMDLDPDSSITRLKVKKTLMSTVCDYLTNLLSLNSDVNLPYLQYRYHVILKKNLKKYKNLFFLSSWKPLKKRAGSCSVIQWKDPRSGSVSKRRRSGTLIEELISAAKEYAFFCSAVASVLAGGLAAGKYKCCFGSASLECRTFFPS
jgi:hypothetical protein